MSQFTAVACWLNPLDRGKIGTNGRFIGEMMHVPWFEEERLCAFFARSAVTGPHRDR